MKLMLLTSILFLSGCNTIQYRDSVWCSSPDLSKGGICVHFLTTATENMDSNQYITWLVGSGDKEGPKICTTASTLADWKGNLEKECSEHSNCNFNSKIIDAIDSTLTLTNQSK
jgi:hypothetical protein